MRQMGTLMINHGVTSKARTCAECHAPHGILDFRALGYSEQRTRDLENLPELKMLLKAGVKLPPASVTPRTREIDRRDLGKLQRPSGH